MKSRQLEAFLAASRGSFEATFSFLRIVPCDSQLDFSSANIPTLEGKRNNGEKRQPVISAQTGADKVLSWISIN